MGNRIGWLVVGLAVVGSGQARAQGTPGSGDPAFWVQAGLGASTANLGGLVAASVGKGPHLVSARASFVAENLDGGEDEAFDVAILYGRTLRRAGAFRPSASAGIGYIKCEGCDNGLNAAGVGLALSVEAALWPASFTGIGIHGFANANSVMSFAGVAVTIQFGRRR
ncbi:MAG TPA: hypothetical protein VFZ13_15595 [Gemmatimonadales bacterium]